MATKLKMEEKEDAIQPIDHQLIKGKIKHVLVTIPALDERWVQDRKFAFYVFPPTKLQNGSYIPGAKETWMSSMSCVLDDIWWLCELPYHKFWSQIIYNKNSINGIKSFLHIAPLEKLYYRTKDSDILSTYKRVKKAVFQFLKRISRPKESELHYLSDSKYREIMSEHELIPISLVFSICSVYGTKYQDDVYSIVSQIFKWNINLKFERAVLRTIQLFDNLNKKLKASYRELKQNLLCSNNSNDVTEAANAHRNCLRATLQFLANASLNVSSFLSIYKEGCQVFLNHDFDLHLIRVYGKLLIPLAQEIYILFQDCPQTNTSSWLYSLIDLTRLELTKIFEICLSTTLSSMSDTRITQHFIQRHIKLVKNALKTEEFLQDLNSYCNVFDILDKIRRKCPGNLDLSDVDRITETVKEFLSKTDSDSPTEKRNSPDFDGELVQWNEIIDYVKEYYDSDDLCSNSENAYANGVDGIFDDPLSDSSKWSDDSDSNSEYESYLAASDEEPDDSVLPLKVSSSENKPLNSTENNLNSRLADLSLQPASTSSNYNPEMTLSQVQLQSAITHVKDILPHLGDGFVAMCLEYYKMDPSAVINAILEETLPPYLKSLDFNLPQIAADVQQKIDSTLQNSAVCDDKNKLRELKRVEYSSYTEMLNDKTEIRNAKNVYESYRNVEEDELYDDDFDEEMDAVPVAALEVDPEGFYTEYTTVPLHNHNRVLKDQPKRRVSDDEVEEDEVESTSTGPKPLDFCENPEITRARREHQRQVTLNRKYPRNNINRNNRKDSHQENNADERHDKSSGAKNSSENRDRPDKFSQNRNSSESQRRDSYDTREKRDKYSSQPRNAYENRDRSGKNPSQNRNSYHDERPDRHYPQNRNSTENHEKSDQQYSQNKSWHENRGKRDQPSSQPRNSYENRERYDQPSQSRSYEKRVQQDQSSRNQNSYGNREEDSRNRPYENRSQRNQYSQNSYGNREEQEQPPRNRSFMNRVQNQRPPQNGNSEEQDSSQNWGQGNRETQDTRNSFEDGQMEDQPSQNRDYEQPYSQSRPYEDRRRQDQHFAPKRNSYEDREPYDHRPPQRNSNENRSWRNNSSGENTNNDRERHLKNVHKSRQANHSRKFFSDKKRNF